MFGFIIKASDLADLATAGAFASADSSRPLLTGVLMEVTRDGETVKVTATCTDSYRLAIITRDGETPSGIDDGAMVSALISAKGMAAALKSVLKDSGKNGNVRVTIDSERLRVTFAAGTRCEYPAEIIEGNYPDCRQVVPAGSFYANSDGVKGIGVNPQFIGMFAKLAPWSAKLPTDSIRFEFIDESRPIRAASRDGRTMAYLMPVRVQ